MKESNEYLNQKQIEKLTPEEYSMLLAYGRLTQFDDDEITEESYAKLRISCGI